MPVKISIITATRNMARFLEPCILSVLQQCYSNFEHIIVDGASTDNTLEILRRYPHLRWISEPDLGLSDAMNKGIQMATGDIIGWCNADDLYLPGTLTAANDYLQLHPEIDFLYGDFRVTDELGKSVSVIRETHFSPTVFRWLHVNAVPTPSLFWRKYIHDSNLWCDVSMRYAMDYDLLRRAFEKGYRFKHVSILFSDFRRHGGTLSSAGSQSGRQFDEHELVVRREASVYWKKFKPAFPALRFCFLLVARAARTVEKIAKGYYFEKTRK
jgi:glycosyltransferase involved in cell wall biosynthesis